MCIHETPTVTEENQIRITLCIHRSCEITHLRLDAAHSDFKRYLFEELPLREFGAMIRDTSESQESILYPEPSSPSPSGPLPQF